MHCVMMHYVTGGCKPCRLEPERGHFPGPPPALLPETEPASLQETMLGADELGLGEMGANQVVLVRSEASKERLPAFLRAGLVLTVEESKGLEFDDVCTSPSPDPNLNPNPNPNPNPNRNPNPNPAPNPKTLTLTP